MTSKIQRSVLSFILLLVPASLAACDDEATVLEVPGAGGAGSEPSGNAGTGGTSSSTAGTGGTAGSSSTACVEEPSTPEEFLVRCTDSACRPFDNVARLTRFRVGEPLPEVP